MQKGKLWIWLMTGVLLLAALFGAAKEAEGDYTLSVRVTGDGQSESIICWKESYWKTAYFFLPSYASMEQLQLQTGRDDLYILDGTPVTDGMSCAGFQTGVKYPLETSSEAELSAEYVVFLRSGNVDTMFVDVASGSMTYLNADKTHDETGTMRLYDANGNLAYSGSLDKISGRGQSSWLEEKKSYNITLTREADLLGMGQAGNWILQSNAKDVTNLRNKMVFDFAENAGLSYSPDSRWIDLYLNGEYAGLYLLCERNEVHPERVDISGEGSFLVTKDSALRFQAQAEAFVQTESGAALGIVYADRSNQELLQLWQSVENAILSEDGVDPVSGKHWQDMIHLESWVKKHLLEEVFGNEDAMRLSQFYYLDGSDGSGKIWAGPVWDYDLIMYTQFNELRATRPNNHGTLWPWALYQKDAYYQCLREEYAQVFRPLLLQLADSTLEEYALQIEEAATMNALRWMQVSSQDQIQVLREYLYSRVEFLDSLWLEEKDYKMIFVAAHGEIDECFAVEAGTPIGQLPDYSTDPSIVVEGWYYTDTDLPVDLSDPVWEDTSVYLKYSPAPQEEAEDPEEDASLLRYAPTGALLVLLVAAVGMGLWQLRFSAQPGQKHREKARNKR